MTAQFSYGGRDRVPGISAITETFENEFLWGPYPAQFISGLQISGAARDAGNSDTTILRAGLLLGLVTATNKLMEWDPTATDGTEYIWGILHESRTTQTNNANQDRLTGHIVVGGGLLSKGLIIPGNASTGIAGDALEYLVRAQLRGRFMLNDSYYYNRPEYVIHTVSAAEQSAGITLTHADSHRHFYNTGGSLTAALGALAPYKGVEFKFTAPDATTDEITVTSGSSNIQTPGAADTNSLSVDGATVRLVGTGSFWLVDTY